MDGSAVPGGEEQFSVQVPTEQEGQTARTRGRGPTGLTVNSELANSFSRRTKEQLPDREPGEGQGSVIQVMHLAFPV